MHYPYSNFYEMLQGAVDHRGSRTAIYIDEDKVSYRQLREKSDQFATFLTSKGIKKGDIVAMVLPNSLEFIVALFAISKIGAVLSAINNFLKRNEYEYILNDSKATLLITSTKYKKEVLDIDAITPLEHVVWIDEKPLEKPNYSLFSESESCDTAPYDKTKSGQLDDLAVVFYTSGTTGFPKGGDDYQ